MKQNACHLSAIWRAGRVSTIFFLAFILFLTSLSASCLCCSLKKVSIVLSPLILYVRWVSFSPAFPLEACQLFLQGSKQSHSLASWDAGPGHRGWAWALYLVGLAQSQLEGRWQRWAEEGAELQGSCGEASACPPGSSGLGLVWGLSQLRVRDQSPSSSTAQYEM